MVVFYEYMNHALYYKVIGAARSQDIPMVYVKGTNADNILKSIIMQIKGRKYRYKPIIIV